jgi:predicted MFS family arabinose efflux permease
MGVYWLALLGVWRVSAFVGVMPVFMAVGSAFSARALITATAARIVSDHDQGLAFGMVETLMSVAVAIAAWIAGHLYPLSPAHDLPLIVSLAAIPMMVMLWFILRVQAQVTVEPAETPVAAAPGH